MRRSRCRAKQSPTYRCRNDRIPHHGLGTFLPSIIESAAFRPGRGMSHTARIYDCGGGESGPAGEGSHGAWGNWSPRRVLPHVAAGVRGQTTRRYGPSRGSVRPAVANITTRLTTTHRDQLLQELCGNRSDMKESVLNHRNHKKRWGFHEDRKDFRVPDAAKAEARGP